MPGRTSDPLESSAAPAMQITSTRATPGRTSDPGGHQVLRLPHKSQRQSGGDNWLVAIGWWQLVGGSLWVEICWWQLVGGGWLVAVGW